MDTINPLDIAKRLHVKQNVTIRVIDEPTGKVVQEHVGHNAATNSLLTGIAHYLMGDGVLNQGSDTLMLWVPQYISLGTMGLTSQDSETYTVDGATYIVPAGIGYTPVAPEDATDEEKRLNAELRFSEYINQTPGYGADGYDNNANNDREWFGLGYPYTLKPNKLVQDFYNAGATDYILTHTPINADKTSIVSVTVYPDGIINQDIHDTSVVRSVVSVDNYDVIYDTNAGEYHLTLTEGSTYTGRIAVIYMVNSGDATNCELISAKVDDNGNVEPLTLRSKITYRDLVPEIASEVPNTLDIVYSAMVSTGALKDYRGDNDYVYITEAGLWSKPYYSDSGDNGLLAGYRIMPTDDAIAILGTEKQITSTGVSDYTVNDTIISIDSITCSATMQTITGDGETNHFTLIRNTEIISVTINDEPTTYTIEDNIIVFDTAPEVDDRIVITYTNNNVVPDTGYSFTANSGSSTLTFYNGYIPVKDKLIIMIYRSGDNQDTWKDMRVEANRQKVQSSILRIGVNQVAQIVWKIQLGGLEQLNGLRYLYPSQYPEEVWEIIK